MRRFLTAAAVIALAASVAHAQGNGKGNERGGGQSSEQGGQMAGPSMQDSGKGRGNAERGKNEQAAGASMQGEKDRGNSRGQGETRAERGNSGNDPGKPGNSVQRSNVRAASDDRGQGNAVRQRGGDIAQRARNDNRTIVNDNRRRGSDAAVRDVVRVRNLAAIPARGLVAGCPPGLASKNPPCVPPGQVRTPFRSFDRPEFWGLRLDDGRYRYDNGYLVRLGTDGRIGSYVPLLGGALAIGNLWPTSYAPVALPAYYENYYGLGPYDSYRYADDVIYRIDPETDAITSIAALLTGDTFAVGQPMPLGYDVYNVPYDYRDEYYDTPDALYRYSDGYLYQVDPETRLIAAVIELLT